MDPTNSSYGHSNVLAKYCYGTRSAFRAPPRIAGAIQHGWTFVHGFGVGYRVKSGFGKFIWSDVVRRRGQAINWRDFSTIGAPWIYLRALEPLDPPAERAGTIWYPFHGWDRNEILGDHDRLIAEIREVEDGPVTICLYWLEHRNPRVRAIYEEAGFRVICHGERDGDPEFLFRQRAELRRHKRVASNRLTTAIFYGISEGCEPAIYGDPMYMDGTHPLYEGRDLVPRLYPELHGTATDLPAARDIAEVELGTAHMVSPEELRMLFHWPSLKEMSR